MSASPAPDRPAEVRQGDPGAAGPQYADPAGDRAAGVRPASGGRWLDTGLSVLLGLLVAGSLVMTGRLWLTNPYLTPPPQQPGAYVASDAIGRELPADLLAPARIVLRLPSGAVRGLGNRSDPAFQAIWTTSRQVLARIGRGNLAAGRPSDVASLASAAASGPSAELWFGARVPWLAMRAVLATRSGTGGPPVDRVLVRPAATGTQVFLASGTAVRRISLPAAAGRALVQELDALPDAGNPLRPLGSGTGGVRVLPGVFVPVGVPPPVNARLEPLNVRALVDVSFRDPSVVRTARERNGARFFTDGEDWLRISRLGAARWAAPEAGGRLHGGWVAALTQAVGFVDRRGGWPSSATFVGAQAVAAPGGLSGSGAGAAPALYRLSFAVRYQGWEVVGNPPAVSVSVGTSGVTSYLRRVPVVTGVEPGSVSGITAELGLQSLAAAWPPGVAPGARLVVDVFTCYVYRGGHQLIPAWDYQLADGSQVAVDALSGRVIGLVSTLT